MTHRNVAYILRQESQAEDFFFQKWYGRSSLFSSQSIISYRVSAILITQAKSPKNSIVIHFLSNPDLIFWVIFAKLLIPSKKTVNISLIPSSLSLIWGLIKKSFAPRFSLNDSYRNAAFILRQELQTEKRFFPNFSILYWNTLVFLRLNDKLWGFCYCNQPKQNPGKIPLLLIFWVIPT